MRDLKCETMTYIQFVDHVRSGQHGPTCEIAETATLKNTWVVTFDMNNPTRDVGEFEVEARFIAQAANLAEVHVKSYDWGSLPGMGPMVTSITLKNF